MRPLALYAALALPLACSDDVGTDDTSVYDALGKSSTPDQTRVAGETANDAITPVKQSKGYDGKTGPPDPFSSKLVEGAFYSAVERGFLHPFAREDQLTPEIRMRLLDSYVCEDAVDYGYLPRGSTYKDLTLAIRAKMSDDGMLRKYRIDGYVILPWEEARGANAHAVDIIPANELSLILSTGERQRIRLEKSKGALDKKGKAK